MKQTISLIIVLFIWNNLSAESISGKIIDSKTKSNIANVRVIIKDYSSTLTDNAGKFTLKIPDNIDKNKIIINFDMPGYSYLDVALNNLNKNNNILLMDAIHKDAKSKELNHTKSEVKKEGITKGSSTFIFMLDNFSDIGGEFGFIVKKHTPCYLSSLNLYIGNTKIRNLKFRINIYDINNNYKRINDQEIISSVDMGNFYLAHDGWVKFDLFSYNIKIDRETLIVFENIFHPTISNDIELSFPGLSAITTKNNCFYRTSYHENFEKLDLKLSMFAELIPIN